MSCTLIFFKKFGKKPKITTCHILFIPYFREYFSKNWIFTWQSIHIRVLFIYLFLCGDIPSFIIYMWMLLIYVYNFQIFWSEKNASISYLLIYLFYDQFKALNRIMHGWRRREWIVWSYSKLLVKFMHSFIFI